VSEPLTIDGVGPLPVLTPPSAAELGGLVREAAAAGRGIYPVGGRTTLEIGQPPAKPGAAISTAALAGIIDYPARDLTVTVRAGTRIAELQRTLAGEGQRLPVDVPDPERATLGGAIAVNQSGPRRFGLGTFRDWVIGVGFVAADGTEVAGGGRVVKNVAGYDLMKLHTGALGTLVVLTRVTLKVTPVPQEQALVSFGLSAAAVGPTLDRLHASASRPVAVELLNTTAARSAGLTFADPWVIVAGFEEKAVTVAWQVETLRRELADAPVRGVDVLRSRDCDPLWAALTQLQSREASRFIWKATVRPSKVAEFVNQVTAEVPYLIHAHALNGIVWLHAPDEFDPAAGSALAWMDQCSTRCGGTEVVRRCPTEWKRVFRIWGRPGSDRELMRAVKQALDPADVLNPGRL
jgi:glycolate oxidase FAD binding subunit